MVGSRSKTGIDWPLIIMCLILLGFGIMNIYSVDTAKGLRQMTFAGLSLILVIGFISVSGISTHFFETTSPFIYLFSLCLLIGVLIFGREINGAKAWFDLGFISFQPVEVAKLGTGLLLARYVSSTNIDMKSRKTVLTIFSILLIPIFLIMLQPDLGSVIVFSAFIVALYREGMSGWYITTPVISGFLFLASIIFPSDYVLLGIGWVTLIVCVFIAAISYNRLLLRTVLGVQISLFLFFIFLIILRIFFPNLGMIDDISSRQYVEDEIISFDVYMYSAVGILVSLISILSVSDYLKREDSNSAGLFTSRFFKTPSYNIAVGSSIVFLLIMSLSLSSLKIYTKLPIHQRERLMVLFEGEGKYRDTSGYNLLYSKTAIGSGDFLGKGYLQGTVKIGRFVPEQSTDYIFCTVGEEWGFLGSALLIILYGSFILRIYYLSEGQRNTFSRFFGYSVATIFLMHFFINIAMVMGLFPTVGIPLPFFSYGGSSLWAFITLITLFLILNYKDKQSLI